MIRAARIASAARQCERSAGMNRLVRTAANLGVVALALVSCLFLAGCTDPKQTASPAEVVIITIIDIVGALR